MTLVVAYRNNVPTGRVVTFERSGHFPHFEEPQRYAELVRAFVSGLACGLISGPRCAVLR